VATAFAPTSTLADGSYTWHVIAVDAAGHTLGTSETRSFRVDGTPPKVLSVTPSQLKPSSNIRVTFSERVTGVSGKSLKLYRVVHKKRTLIAAVVSTARKGKIGILDPKGTLKPGSYLVVLVASKIHDRAGNALVPSSAAPALKAALR
jgi:hypothetical protein